MRLMQALVLKGMSTVVALHEICLDRRTYLITAFILVLKLLFHCVYPHVAACDMRSLASSFMSFSYVSISVACVFDRSAVSVCEGRWDLRAQVAYDIE